MGLDLVLFDPSRSIHSYLLSGLTKYPLVSKVARVVFYYFRYAHSNESSFGLNIAKGYHRLQYERQQSKKNNSSSSISNFIQPRSSGLTSLFTIPLNKISRLS